MRGGDNARLQDRAQEGGIGGRSPFTPRRGAGTGDEDKWSVALCFESCTFFANHTRSLHSERDRHTFGPPALRREHKPGRREVRPHVSWRPVTHNLAASHHVYIVGMLELRK